MIEIEDKRNCTGCGACVNSCPYNIISLKEDDEGFMYPEVIKNKCVDCHLCEKSCPMLNDFLFPLGHHSDFPQFFAGQLRNKEDLTEVSSGGAFLAFALTVIESGGVVYGAIQEEVDTIIHVRTETTEGIKRIRRSKYFQSDTGLTFREVKKDLKAGRLVLYSGTGCQISGLISYLGGQHDNLITCDVVCHGVPSRKVWRAYRGEKEEKEGKLITGLVFRDKSEGWSHNQYKITYEDGTIEKEYSTKQLFHAGYLRGLFNRPSCGSCRFASLSRVADITLADYWKYKGRFHLSGCDLGVSLITVNSLHGIELLSRSSKFLDFETTEKDLALQSCRHLARHPVESPDRAAFFKLLSDHGYYTAASKYIVKVNKHNYLTRVKRKVRKLLNYLFLNFEKD